MAQPDFVAAPMRVSAPKPKMNVYFTMLILSLVCMLLACLFMYLEVRRFGGFGTVPQRIAAVTQREALLGHRGHRDHRIDHFGSSSESSVSSVA
jgi:hypothetical protein